MDVRPSVRQRCVTDTSVHNQRGRRALFDSDPVCSMDPRDDRVLRQKKECSRTRKPFSVNCHFLRVLSQSSLWRSLWHYTCMHTRVCMHRSAHTHVCTHTWIHTITFHTLMHVCTHASILRCSLSLTHTRTLSHTWLPNPCGNESPVSRHTLILALTQLSTGETGKPQLIK